MAETGKVSPMPSFERPLDMCEEEYSKKLLPCGHHGTIEEPCTSQYRPCDTALPPIELVCNHLRNLKFGDPLRVSDKGSRIPRKGTKHILKGDTNPLCHVEVGRSVLDRGRQFTIPTAADTSSWPKSTPKGSTPYPTKHRDASHATVIARHLRTHSS